MYGSTKQKIVWYIRGQDRGWTFSARDIPHLGTRSTIDITLHRLAEKGEIRRIIRGIYDYPLQKENSNIDQDPDIQKVADALARKFGWRIQAPGKASLHFMGLSPDEQLEWTFLSNGPDRSYMIGQQKLEFRHQALKDAGFFWEESKIIVSALKSLGKQQVTPEVLDSIRRWVNPDVLNRVRVETKTSAIWIHDAISNMCIEKKGHTSKTRHRPSNRHG